MNGGIFNVLQLLLLRVRDYQSFLISTVAEILCFSMHLDGKLEKSKSMARKVIFLQSLIIFYYYFCMEKNTILARVGTR